MKFFHSTDRGQRGGIKAAALLWIIGVPGIAALLIGFLVCR